MTGDELSAEVQRNATAAIVNVAGARPGRSYHFVVAVCRIKEHNPLRKLLEYHS